MTEPGGNAGPILVVEDEALVAMMIADTLEDLGWRVIGPAATVAQALELMATEEPMAAVLDVNLGGETVYPVAEALRQRAIPYLFLTGYGVAGVEPDFAAARVLQKPVRGNILTGAVEEILSVHRSGPLAR